MRLGRPLLFGVLALAGILQARPATPIHAASSNATIAHLTFSGTTRLSGLAGGSGALTEGAGSNLEIAPSLDQAIPHSGLKSAHIPSAGVPKPSGNALAGTNPGFSGFNGLSHLDQRTAGTGIYANTQFSLEPPDQALCVGNGFVLESVNTALAVYNTAGAPVTGAVALNQLFGLQPEITRSAPPVYGDFTSDPKCYYDSDTGHWFLTVLQISVNPATGAFSNTSHLEIALSQTNDPTGAWNLFAVNSTDDGTNGTPTHAGCPCFGDQPLIGADANGFYITTNEFSILGPQFNGTQIYAMSKTGLEAGSLPPVVHLNAGALATPDVGGIWYSIQPSTSPNGVYDTTNGGTEYALSALDFGASLDNRVAVWALSNTGALNTASPANVNLSFTVIGSEVYGQPPAAQQMSGPTPLSTTYIPQIYGVKTPPTEKLELINSNDDRMNQVVYAGGQLWSGVNTVLKTQNGPSRVGIAYFVVQPSVANSQVAGTMTNQGYVSLNQENVLFPSIGVNTAGKGVISFSVVGPDIFPSTGYAPIDAVHGAGDIHIAGAGAGPEDGFTGYKAFGGSRVARWGDYSAAVAGPDGSIWLAAEYIPGTARTILANWGTFVSNVTP